MTRASSASSARTYPDRRGGSPPAASPPASPSRPLLPPAKHHTSQHIEHYGAVDNADESRITVRDAVFGDLEDGGPDYRGVTPASAFVLMAKANFGLGVLAIPSVFDKLGLIPGIAAIVAIQAMYTWSASFIGPFKIAHPEVYSLGDAAFVFAGKAGREFFGAMFIIFFVFCAAAALVGVSVGLNAVTAHGACTAVFVALAAIVGWALSSIRTLSDVSWVGWAGLVSILSAVVTLTVAVATQDRPASAPPHGPWDKNFKLIGSPSFVEAMTSLNVILFSSASSPIYYGIVSEMKDPHKFTKPVLATYAFLTSFYVVVGSMVYYFCGQYVASPALGSAGLFLKKVCYGLALPGLFASLTIFNHVSAKVVFVRLLSGTRHLAANTPRHWATWLGSTFGAMLAAYLIASAIPIFSSLIKLSGAVFCPITAIAPMVLGWNHDHLWSKRDTPLSRRERVTAAINALILCLCVFLTIAGVYAAVVDLYHEESEYTRPWSCENNAGPVA
ncbi:hypothetical protein VHUM_01956 [Vanrija humicola]|uniref:Amino acid transporter transmembrane domain-containing protein n=1 Tax=Vanrija humicola TaxID=5417 RepID=A0A7D8V362_VANHU|nr:hypothetical protein VHUM_01956 [Vanrija humicola]